MSKRPPSTPAHNVSDRPFTGAASLDLLGLQRSFGFSKRFQRDNGNQGPVTPRMSCKTMKHDQSSSSKTSPSQSYPIIPMPYPVSAEVPGLSLGAVLRRPCGELRSSPLAPSVSCHCPRRKTSGNILGCLPLTLVGKVWGSVEGPAFSGIYNMFHVFITSQRRNDESAGQKLLRMTGKNNAIMKKK